MPASLAGRKKIVLYSRPGQSIEESISKVSTSLIQQHGKHGFDALLTNCRMFWSARTYRSSTVLRHSEFTSFYRNWSRMTPTKYTLGISGQRKQKRMSLKSDSIRDTTQTLQPRPTRRTSGRSLLLILKWNSPLHHPALPCPSSAAAHSTNPRHQFRGH